MWLRTLAGSRAGQIEDYDYPAAINALRHGFAERVQAPHESQPATEAPPTPAPPARIVDRGERRSRKWRR